MLTSLKGAPERVGGGFNCSQNQLRTLEGSPKKVGDRYDCSRNNIRYMKDMDYDITVDGKFIYSFNPMDVFSNIKANDYIS